MEISVDLVIRKLLLIVRKDAMNVLLKASVALPSLCKAVAKPDAAYFSQSSLPTSKEHQALMTSGARGRKNL